MPDGVRLSKCLSSAPINAWGNRHSSTLTVIKVPTCVTKTENKIVTRMKRRSWGSVLDKLSIAIFCNIITACYDQLRWRA